MVTEYGLYTPTDWNRECEKSLEKLERHIDFFSDVLLTSEYYKVHVIEERNETWISCFKKKSYERYNLSTLQSN